MCRGRIEVSGFGFNEDLVRTLKIPELFDAKRSDLRVVGLFTQKLM